MTVKIKEEINGMSVARHIAACLLTDCSLRGEKYYEKEDKFTRIIENALEECKEEDYRGT